MEANAHFDRYVQETQEELEEAEYVIRGLHKELLVETDSNRILELATQVSRLDQLIASKSRIVEKLLLIDEENLLKRDLEGTLLRKNPHWTRERATVAVLRSGDAIERLYQAGVRDVQSVLMSLEKEGFITSR